jgi:catechol 2,3-dioxygenase-like lactoylglutathione lyase family enzyme
MLVVDDVAASSQWFQQVLGLVSAHGGPEYEMLMHGDTLVVQLHRWEAHEHPHMGAHSDPSRGNGVVIWFVTDDFDGLVERVESSEAEVLEGPLFNPNAQQQEVWLRSPDGYVVVVAGPRQV